MNRKTMKDIEHYTDQFILAVDSHNGRYSMQHLIESYDFDNKEELAEHVEMCKTVENEDQEGYYDSWTYILDNARVTHNGVTYMLCSNEDIWFIPADIDYPEWFWDEWII